MRFETGDVVKLPPYIIPQRGHVIGCLPPAVVNALSEEPTVFVAVEVLVPGDTKIIIIDQDDLSIAPEQPPVDSKS